jgi:hypothetical protein
MILLFTPKIRGSHIEHVTEVLSRIRGANLKLNTAKCVWGKPENEVLGHVISHHKIIMDPRKIKAIQERLAPKNVKQLQQILGLTNYYRRFIKEYAKIAQPMFALLSKNTKFVWSEERALGVLPSLKTPGRKSTV